MTLVIDLTPELEQEIREAAAQSGMSPTAYIVESITARLQQTRQHTSSSKHLSQGESSLLQQINQSMSHIDWLRYRELVAKRRATTLTPSEQAELIQCSNEIEAANVKRIEVAAALADLRRCASSVIVSRHIWWITHSVSSMMLLWPA